MENASQRNGSLNLELSLRPPSPPPPPPPLIEQPSSSKQQGKRVIDTPMEEAPSYPKRQRTKANHMPIEPPYPWSSNHRAVVRELEYLQSKNIMTITGDVKCKRCKRKYEMEYDVVEKLDEIVSFIERNIDILHDRAPRLWMEPVLPNCTSCNQENCVEPVIPEKDPNSINWLFLLLGKFIGCLKLEQLRYFCAQTNTHRTGSKNRLVYLTYIALCNQLLPSSSTNHLS